MSGERMAWGSEIAVWCLLFTASVTDLAWGKIYNALTLPFLALGFAFHFWMSGTSGLSSAFFAVLTAALLFFPLYLLKVMAAGDVKLLLAFAAWVNSTWVLNLAFVTILIGAVAGLVLLVARKKFSLRDGFTKMPLAPAFLCAYAFLKIAEMKHWSIL